MPEIATPPAPSSPKPAPQPSPAPPKPPAPAPQPSAEESDPFQNLDSRIGKRPESKPEPKAEPKAETDKAAAPPEKPAPSKEDRTIQAPKALREQLEKTTSELKSRTEAISSLEAKIADYERKGKSTTALVERLAAVEKERDEARAQIRALKHETSDEFKSKWDKPFNRSVDYAKRLVEGLQVGGWVQNEETQAREWKAERAATWDDFAQLYQMPAAKAAQAARQLFGEDADTVIGQIVSLQQKQFERDQALDEEKAQWKEKTAAEEAERARQFEAWNAGIAKMEEVLRQKRPEWYDEDPEDKEGNELLQEGRKLVNYQPKTFQEQVSTYVRNKMNAEAFPRMAHRYALLKEENAELKAKLQEYESNGPGKGKRPAEEGEPEEDWRTEMRRKVPA